MSEMMRDLKMRNSNDDDKLSIFAQNAEETKSWVEFSGEGALEVRLEGLPSWLFMPFFTSSL